MIKVSYNRDLPAISVKGHANHGLQGSDVVCAGVSTLVFTLLHELIRLDIEHSRLMRAGLVEIEAQGGFEQFDTVAAGMMILAENFPENVEFNADGQWPPLQ